MTEISRFYGIVVFMNYREHDPPHFHARYQNQEIMFEIQSGVVQGKMSKRALRMLFEWFEMYREELFENWQLAKERKNLKQVPPLP